MKDAFYYIDLFDYYGDLLTAKQQLYFQDYYFHNLSLAEISENLTISRNAVHKQIKDAEEKLLYYEEKLHLYEKRILIEGLLKKSSNDTIIERIKELI